jgi:hypothetical protein
MWREECVRPDRPTPPNTKSRRPMISAEWNAIGRGALPLIVNCVHYSAKGIVKQIIETNEVMEILWDYFLLDGR